MLVSNGNSDRAMVACRSGQAALPPPPPTEPAAGFPGLDHITLVREAQRGNSAAFEELVRNYDQPVLRLAMRITGSESDAQDIYQDSFLRAYQSLRLSLRVFLLHLDSSHHHQCVPGLPA